jgi:hypothetical protein
LTGGNRINYKEIDPLTDMIIATNSLNYITYIRILSSTTNPFTVDIAKSQIFTDPTYSTSASRKLSAIFIIDQNNAKSLIHDASTLKY